MGKSEARRSDILTIAWKVFLEHGYGSASMSDIAAKVGGSKTTLYNYFESKEDLFLAAVRKKAGEFQGELSKLLQPSEDLKQDLTQFGCRLLRIVMAGDYAAFYRVMIFEAVRFPMIGKLAYDGRRGTVLKPIAERLSQEMDAGRLRRVEPLEAAEVFWDLCSASFNWQSVLGLTSDLTAKDIDHFVTRGVSVFLAAYGASAGDQKPVTTKRSASTAARLKARKAH